MLPICLVAKSKKRNNNNEKRNNNKNPYRGPRRRHVVRQQALPQARLHRLIQPGLAAAAAAAAAAAGLRLHVPLDQRQDHGPGHTARHPGRQTRDPRALNGHPTASTNVGTGDGRLDLAAHRADLLASGRHLLRVDLRGLREADPLGWLSRRWWLLLLRLLLLLLMLGIVRVRGVVVAGGTG